MGLDHWGVDPGRQGGSLPRSDTKAVPIPVPSASQHKMWSVYVSVSERGGAMGSLGAPRSVPAADSAIPPPPRTPLSQADGNKTAASFQL